nr:unnamed protein product [Fasciola hepatica]
MSALISLDIHMDNFSLSLTTDGVHAQRNAFQKQRFIVVGKDAIRSIPRFEEGPVSLVGRQSVGLSTSEVEAILLSPELFLLYFVRNPLFPTFPNQNLPIVSTTYLIVLYL